MVGQEVNTMARMHGNKKGKAGSTQPAVKEKPSWVKYSPKEIELLVVKYAKEGKTSSQIGVYLRDNYGIPDVHIMTGKSITTILEEKDLLKKFPEDLQFLFKKVLAIQDHLEANHKDKPARRGLVLTQSKILRLVRYYKRVGKVDANWNYDPKQLRMYVE